MCSGGCRRSPFHEIIRTLFQQLVDEVEHGHADLVFRRKIETDAQVFVNFAALDGQVHVSSELALDQFNVLVDDGRIDM